MTISRPTTGSRQFSLFLANASLQASGVPLYCNDTPLKVVSINLMQCLCNAEANSQNISESKAGTVFTGEVEVDPNKYCAALKENGLVRKRCSS